MAKNKLVNFIHFSRTSDMTFANIIVGTLGAHGDLVTRVVLVLSILYDCLFYS